MQIKYATIQENITGTITTALHGVGNTTHLIIIYLTFQLFGQNMLKNL